MIVRSVIQGLEIARTAALLPLALMLLVFLAFRELKI